MLTTLLLASLPVWAIGSFGPSDDNDEDFAARALLIQDGDGTVAAVQIDPKSQDAVTSWLLPIPGTVDGNIEALKDNTLERLLKASDPLIVKGSDEALGCGCTSSLGDTGEMTEVRVFDKDKTIDNLTIDVYGPGEMDTLITAATTAGLSIGSDEESAIASYANDNWSVALVQLGSGIKWDKASPVLAYRYDTNEVALPMALSKTNIQEEVQTLVMIAAQHRMNPADSKGVQPRLGTPAFRTELMRKFYNARVRIAIEEAGGHAWVLEYANTLEQLQLRVDDNSILDFTGPVDEVFDDLQGEGILSEDFGREQIFLTRWRSFVKPGKATDESFAEDSGDETYEIYLGRDDFKHVRKGTFFFPLLAMGWWTRRRRTLS